MSSKLLDMLERLGLSDCTHVMAATSDYEQRQFSPPTLEDELMDITEEEVRVMESYTPGYTRWYGDKLDSIILGVEDEI